MQRNVVSEALSISFIYLPEVMLLQRYLNKNARSLESLRVIPFAR